MHSRIHSRTSTIAKLNLQQMTFCPAITRQDRPSAGRENGVHVVCSLARFS